MNDTIIDAHAHLWLRQDTVVNDLPIPDTGKRTLAIYGRDPSDGSSFYGGWGQ